MGECMSGVNCRETSMKERAAQFYALKTEPQVTSKKGLITSRLPQVCQ